MGQLICVANFLEKSGRTITSVNLAASLAVLEKTVLLVDCDPTGSASLAFDWGKGAVDFGLDDLLTGIVSARAVVKKTALPCLDIIPAGESLGDIETTLAHNPGKEKILGIVLEKFKSQYDFIVFDTAGHKSLLSRSVLLACDSLMIPAHLVPETPDSILSTLAFAGEARKGMVDSLRLCGILFWGCGSLDEVHRFFDEDQLKDVRQALCPVTIPSSLPAMEREPDKGPVCLVDIKSDRAEAFLDLSYEFLYRESMKQTA